MQASSSSMFAASQHCSQDSPVCPAGQLEISEEVVSLLLVGDMDDDGVKEGENEPLIWELAIVGSSDGEPLRRAANSVEGSSEGTSLGS
mmetsp:Transcript_10161/g.21976  ORF Transcript_10161/g.21976 Transcript_10161/m.21976 type:complete len:89 (-) Transcript_10161:354-620(-)